MPSFGGEVKASVTCRRFAACKRSLNVAWKSTFRQNYRIILAHRVPPFAARGLPRCVDQVMGGGHLAVEAGTSKLWGDQGCTISHQAAVHLGCMLRGLLAKKNHVLSATNSSSTIILYVDLSQRTYLTHERSITGHYINRYLQGCPSQVYLTIFTQFFRTIFLQTHLIHLQFAQYLLLADRCVDCYMALF